MSKFDHIVRPFQTPQVTYPTRIFDPSRPAVEDVVKTFGEEGNATSFGTSFQSSVTSYVDQKTKEIDRSTETKRIENESDPSQFVNVELIKKLTTESGKGKKYQKTDYEFKNT